VTRVGALVLFGLGCATLGGWWRGAPARAVPHAAPAPMTRLSAEDRAELRRALSEDVRLAVAAALPPSGTLVRADSAPAGAMAAPAGAMAAPAEAMVAQASAPPSAAHDAAQRVLEGAITRGVWQPDDAQALRATLPELSQVEASQVLAELSRVVNTGQVQVPLHDRPLI
jgi:hypothetical protein